MSLYNNNPYTDIHTLTIYLGAKCDMDCIYCRDKMLSPHPEIDNEKLDKIIEFIPKLKGLTVLGLVGGEPFIYWKYIKKILDSETISKTNINRVLFISNGLALKNDKIWEYLINDPRCFIQLSNDGPTTKEYRLINTLDDPIIRNRAIQLNLSNKLLVSTVMTDKSWDMIDMYRYFYNIFGEYFWMYTLVFDKGQKDSFLLHIDPNKCIKKFDQFLHLWPYSLTAKRVLFGLLNGFGNAQYRRNLLLNANLDIVENIWNHDAINFKLNDYNLYDYFIRNKNCISTFYTGCYDCGIKDLCHKQPTNCNPITRKIRNGIFDSVLQIMRENNYQDAISFKKYIEGELL